jgi:uncharacterized protein (TIGR03085 family)
MRHHALDERRALAKTLRRTGPDAPTLCGDWRTAQLAAHLVLRERSLVELAGRAPVERWRRRAEGRIDDLVARARYEDLVSDVERGPSVTDFPVGAVWAVPLVREATNLLEYLVHHEDVRRAAPGWTPRPLPVDVQMAVWKRLPIAGRFTLRKVSVGLELDWPAHGSIHGGRARGAAPAVRVTGEPVELALFAFGRIDVAQVEYAGDPDDVAMVRGAEIGI